MSNRKDYDKKGYAKLDGEASTSLIANILKIVAILIAVGGFVLGIFLSRDVYGDFSLTMMILYWVIAFIGCVMFLGFAEILERLQNLQSGAFDIYIESKEKCEDKYEPINKISAENKTSIKTKVVKETNEVHFSSRPTSTIVCPLCNREQKSNRATCFQCGAKFIFDDEIIEP